MLVFLAGNLRGVIISEIMRLSGNEGEETCCSGVVVPACRNGDLDGSTVNDVRRSGHRV